MDQSDALKRELGEVLMKWIFLETRSTSITQKQKAFKIQDFLTFDTIDEQIFEIQQNSKFSEIFGKNHECSFFKRNDGPAFFVFFGSLFAGEYGATN